MKTLFVILQFGILGTLCGWVVSFLANLAGAAGVLLGSLGRLSDLSGFRKALAVIVCALFQAYVFLAWVAFVVSYTPFVTSTKPVVHWLAWIVSFYVAMVPVISAIGQSTREERNDPQLKRSVPHVALGISGMLDTIGFFVFAFLPKTMLYGWAWVPFVREASGTIV